MSLRDVQAQVREFQKAFGHPVASKPAMISAERAAKRQKWLEEEVQEMAVAPTLVDLIDGMVDAIYIISGTAEELGIDLQPFFDIVHNANMSKLGPDGKPMYYPDGKVKKPEGWVAPEPLIAAELERQAKA